MEATDLRCPDCGREMKLQPGRWGAFYGCVGYPLCKGAHGAHPDGSPLGKPADATTRAWRIKAHASFDRLWKTHYMTRKEAYKWLERVAQKKKCKPHIGDMDIATCRWLIQRVDKYLNNEADAWRQHRNRPGYTAEDIKAGRVKKK